MTMPEKTWIVTRSSTFVPDTAVKSVQLLPSESVRRTTRLVAGTAGFHTPQVKLCSTCSVMSRSKKPAIPVMISRCSQVAPLSTRGVVTSSLRYRVVSCPELAGMKPPPPRYPPPMIVVGRIQSPSKGGYQLPGSAAERAFPATVTPFSFVKKLNHFVVSEL